MTRAAADQFERFTFLLQKRQHRHEGRDTKRHIRPGGVQPPLIETKARGQNFGNCLVQAGQQHASDSCVVLHP